MRMCVPDWGSAAPPLVSLRSIHGELGNSRCRAAITAALGALRSRGIPDVCRSCLDSPVDCAADYVRSQQASSASEVCQVAQCCEAAVYSSRPVDGPKRLTVESYADQTRTGSPGLGAAHRVGRRVAGGFARALAELVELESRPGDNRTARSRGLRPPHATE